MKNVFFFLALLFILACNKQNTNPTANQSFPSQTWLKEKMENYQKTPHRVEIYECTYKTQTVYLIDDCVGCVDDLVGLYNTNGEILGEFGGIDGRNTCPDFYSVMTNKKLVWTNNYPTTEPTPTTTATDTICSCTIVNPLENLKWLKQKRDFYQECTEASDGKFSQKIEIYQYSYQNKKVYLIDYCANSNCADGLIQVFDCKGHVIGEFGGMTGEHTGIDPRVQAVKDSLLWTNIKD